MKFRLDSTENSRTVLKISTHAEGLVANLKRFLRRPMASLCVLWNFVGRLVFTQPGYATLPLISAFSRSDGIELPFRGLI